MSPIYCLFYRKHVKWRLIIGGLVRSQLHSAQNYPQALSSYMKLENRPKSRQENIVVQEMDGEVLIYDLVKNKAFCLNQTSSLVWQACDGRRTIGEIGNHLSDQLGNHSEDVLWLALDQLSKDDLIDAGSYLPVKFEGMSRREVIRKIGLSTVAALPVIAALVAPTAIHANSACMTVMNGCLCNFQSGFTPYPVGADCSSMTINACADMNCRCVQTAGPLATPDNCVP